MFTDDSIRRLSESLKKGAPITGPSDVQILPSPRCNASCVFCPLHAIPDDMIRFAPRFGAYDSDLPGGLLDRLADDLYHLGGLKRVTVTGGEPLLYSHIIPAVFQFTRSFPDASLTVVTNGIKLKGFASFFVRAGLHNLTVSINAGSRESYKAQNPGASAQAFDEILAGVTTLTRERKALSVKNPYVTLSVVLTQSSATDVERLFEIGRNTHADAVTFLPLMEIKLGGKGVNEALAVSPDGFEKFKAEMARFGEKARAEGFHLDYAGNQDDGGVMRDNGMYKSQPCYSGYAFAAVFPNGDIRPCCHCEPVMGNLTRQSFAEIWTSEKYQRMREKMLKITEDGDMAGCLCGECGYAYENAEFHRRLAG